MASEAGQAGGGVGLRLGDAPVGVISALDEMGPALSAAFQHAHLDVRRAAVDDENSRLVESIAETLVVVLTAPYHAVEARIPRLRAVLADKIVVAAAADVSFDADGYVAMVGPSVAERLAEAFPESTVVGAFQLLGARHVTLALHSGWESDVALTGDDEAALDIVSALVESIPGLTPVRAGALRSTAAVEGFVAGLRQVEDDRGRPLGVRFGEQGPTILT